MSVEVMSFRYTYRGKPAGTQVIKTELKGRHTQLEGKAQFQGALGNATVVQRSRCSAERFFSLRYLEETQERNESRSFDVTFDPQTGLVSAVKGQKDQASVPYLVSYRDPLSLLHELRTIGERAEPVLIPLLGKTVSVQYGGEVELDGPFGPRRARAYVLHPGQSVVYVDNQAPHHILKLTQRLADGHLDALLIKVASEAALEPFGEAPVRGGRRRGGGGGGGNGGKAQDKGEQRGPRRRPRRRRRT